MQRSQSLEKIQKRPYVGIVEFTPGPVKESPPRLEIRVRIKNLGMLPAYNVQLSCTWNIRERSTDKILEELKFVPREKELGCLFPDQELSYLKPIYEPHLDLLEKDSVKLFIKYELRYFCKYLNELKKTSIEYEYYPKEGVHIMKKGDTT